MKLAFIIMLLFSTNLFAAATNRSSFAIQCDDNKKILPLSYFEFADQIKDEVQTDVITSLQKTSPVTFNNLNNEFKSLKLNSASFSLPTVNQYDPLSDIPKNCKVLMMIKEESSGVQVNQEFWNTLDKGTQEYFKIDYLLQKYLTPSLSKFDFRRFSVYLSKGQFGKSTVSDKIDFLKFHGINEFFYAGISLDISKDVIFYDDQNFIQDAMPLKGSTFLGAIISLDKFITFSKSQQVLAISTTTTFKKVVNNQEFEFFIPEGLDMGASSKDPRYEPRMTFFEDGSVETGVIKPVDHYFDLIKDLKSTRGYFVVSFHSNHSPDVFQMGECGVYMDGCEGSGKISYNKKSFKVSYVKWYANKNFERLIFSKFATVEIPGNGTYKLEQLYFHEDGTPASAWPSP
jgi:hypothetical protein